MTRPAPPSRRPRAWPSGGVQHAARPEAAAALTARQQRAEPDRAAQARGGLFGPQPLGGGALGVLALALLGGLSLLLLDHVHQHETLAAPRSAHSEHAGPPKVPSLCTSVRFRGDALLHKLVYGKGRSGGSAWRFLPLNSPPSLP